MCGSHRKGGVVMRAPHLSLLALLIVSAASCHRPEIAPRLTPTASNARAERRAYDGAPPVIPHAPLGGTCVTCHTETAREVPGVGIAPPNPHRHTLGMSEQSRCVQCHVFRTTEKTLVANRFQGLAQNLRHGERFSEHAPPVLPHDTFMREDCRSCHAGLTARPEVRCSHPERIHCAQCHAGQAAMGGGR